MQRLAHLSDLHFGRNDARLSIKILETLAQLQPDVVVFSGDFTQRARRGQFAEAKAFLDQVKIPALKVPGNHDIPLYNLPVRIFSPYYGYKKYISPTLEPVLNVGALHLYGINSTKPWNIMTAEVSKESIRRLLKNLSAAPKDAIRILIAHHSLSEIMRASPEFQAVVDSGFDLYLCGHGHHTSSETLQTPSGKTFIHAQAGTATSTRMRGETNAWNFFEFDDGKIYLSVYTVVGTEFIRKINEIGPIPVPTP